MSDAVQIIAELRELRKELDATIRECTALTCAVAIASGIPGLDTPEKVASACRLVHEEIAKSLRQGRVV